MNWVKEVLRRYNLEAEFEAQRPLQLWPSVVGPQIASITRALRFSNGVLTVVVSSPTARHELSLLKAQYVTRLNDAVGKHVVREIRLVPGRIPPPHRITPLPPVPQFSGEAAQLFAHITDPLLHRAFTRLYATLRQRDEALLAAGAKRCPRCGVVFFGDGDLCPGCRFDHASGDEPR